MDISSIIQQLFQQPSLKDVSLEKVDALSKRYPFFATAQYLLLRKMKDEKLPGFEKQLQKTALYFNNPQWLLWLMKEEETEVLPAEMVQTTAPAADPEKKQEPLSTILTSPDNGNGLSFEPYHTIDYFASQGIKLSKEVPDTDKLGKQLKSFTEWLKVMRRLPEATIEKELDSSKNKEVEAMAAHSIKEKEIVTEAMAEVLAMQGKTDKAIDMYQKLSLLEPRKSTYFAAKIEALK